MKPSAKFSPKLIEPKYDIELEFFILTVTFTLFIV